MAVYLNRTAGTNKQGWSWIFFITFLFVCSSGAKAHLFMGFVCDLERGFCGCVCVCVCLCAF